MKPISDELAAHLAPRVMRTGVKNGRGGCWIRTSMVNPRTGYTSIVDGRGGVREQYYAHRIMYVRFKGPIPDGLEIDHLCEVPACCNPDHLEAVTHGVNIRRSTKHPAAVARCRRLAKEARRG